MVITTIPKSILFLCFNLLTLFPQSQSRFLDTLCNNSNYTANSTYETNLNSAASTTTNGFFNRSAGQSPDTVNALVLCRGDVVPEACHQCINDSLGMAKMYCPYRTSATVWYDDCMLRFSDEKILGNVDTNGRIIWTANNLPNAEELYRSMRPLMDRLKTEAAGGDSIRKFASGDTQGPGFMTIYGLMQCTPELSEDECYNCLETATNQISNLASLDVRILYRSCIVRYSNARFFNATVVLSPPPMEAFPPPPVVVLSPQPIGKNSNKTIVIVVTTTVSCFVLALILLCVFIRKRKMERSSGVNSGVYGSQFYFLVTVFSFPTFATTIVVHEHEDTDEISMAKSLQYSFGVLKTATNNFSESNKLGDGGFGVVYKGKLENGKEIAVKRLSRESGQGEQEFKNEVLLLAKLKHRNLVRLLGFSFQGSERLLMYEFVQNASLDKFIFHPLKRMTLNWERRLKIITGIAKGLLYLHEDSRIKIIHRDLKASNILLDAEMTPKIADFGTARLFMPEESQANTFRIVGTYGYMAPEYALYGQFSVKSDVYSFGVLILEIMTGCNNHSFQNGVVTENLLSHAWKCWRDGTTTSLIDSTLIDGSSPLRDMIRCIHIGLLCVQEEAADRPTIASVVLMLASSSVTLAVPSEPAFFTHTHNHNSLLIHDHTSSTTNSIQQS
ncbi:cysteine-rich receptor-like protein kinase 15 [Bidens hawaiensis]|uniref:cysteine-rich receptor-like protein kinase 15 n=1 Tax=Bidens hawaiensis TaxID=980011 RepID=UPI00404A3BEF